VKGERMGLSRRLLHGLPEGELLSDQTWLMLIVDDEPEVHVLTKMVLRDFVYQNQGLAFLSAHSAAEAIAIVDANPDIAVVLLDVVMETEDAGFDVVQHIRKIRQNNAMRIILRTGQPGHAPQRRAIVEYDINDYKEKTELTADRLFTTVMAALRSYRDIITITKSKHGLESIVQNSAALYQAGNNIHKFANAMYTQFTALVRSQELLHHSNYHCIGVLQRVGAEPEIIFATGQYSELVHTAFFTFVECNAKSTIQSAINTGASNFTDTYYLSHLASHTGCKLVFYVEFEASIGEIDHGIVDVFSNNMALAFDNVALTQDIFDTQTEILFTIGDVVETRSKETANHIKRVVELCRILARGLDLSEEATDLLLKACPLHDLGKIGIPDAILNKPGTLDYAEFEIMKTHATIGHEILVKSQRPLFQAAALIAWEHHERWDGTGYPRGLQGDAIHIFARITSVADVYDALCHQRVYKAAWPPSQAREYIELRSGTMFDPAVVAIFIAVYPQLLGVIEAYPD
jgi:response regulator RpfG family c-di-GMP phosphodiesterase